MEVFLRGLCELLSNGSCPSLTVFSQACRPVLSQRPGGPLRRWVFSLHLPPLQPGPTNPTRLASLPSWVSSAPGGHFSLSVWRGHSRQRGSPRVFRSARGHHCPARSVSGSLGFTPVAWFSSFFVCFFLDGRRVNPTIPSTACLPLLSPTLLTGFAPCPRSYNKEPPLARPHTPSS